MDTCKLRRFGWMAVVVALVMGCGTRARGPRPLHAASTSMGAAHLWLPGHTGPQWVNYEVVDGDAYFEGDINLGPVATLTERYHAARAPIARVPIVGAKHATAVTSKSSLWPGGVIPYELGSGLSERHRQWCVDAARTVTEKTVLTVRPRMLGDKDYVVFTKTGRGCHSKLGRVGGAQKIGAYGCGPPTLVHELLHAAGFYHEQSRPDRDSYVEIIWSEIRPGGESQFRKREKARTFGPYDFDSIMHYGAHSHSKTGKPTMRSKIPGKRLKVNDELSRHDIAGVRALYGTTPAPLPPVITRLPWQFPNLTPLPGPAAGPWPALPATVPAPTLPLPSISWPPAFSPAP